MPNSPQKVYTQWKLILEDESGNEEVFVITGDTTTIGRDAGNDIPLDDPQVSKYHARLTQPGDQLVIEDLSSINGTIVNAGPLMGQFTLRHNDTIKIGSFTFRVEKGAGYLPQSRVKTSAHTVAARPIPRPAESNTRLTLFVATIVVALVLVLLFGAFVVGRLSAGDRQPVVGRPSQATATLDLAVIDQTPVKAVTLQPVPTVTPLPEPTDTPNPTASPLPTATPTVTPSPVASPTPREPLLRVTAPHLNVRSGPGLAYSQVAQLAQGDEAGILGQADIGDGLWWQIRYVEAGSRYLGWVSADPLFSTITNAGPVPMVKIPATPTSTPSPTAAATATVTARPTSTGPPAATVSPTAAPNLLRAPDGQTLLIVSNRSLTNQPALLTLSGGKSVGGGREIDAPAGGEIQFTLEPDEYRALWSSPARPGGFVRGADFTAIPGKIMVMWIVPEEGRTGSELYDQLVIAEAPAPTPTPTPVPPLLGEYIAPPGKGLIVAANRSIVNANAFLNFSGGSLGGGQEFNLDANKQIFVEVLPGDYRSVWNLPIRALFLGHEFPISAGEVVLFWVVPEDGTLFIQRPGQAPLQINN